MTLKIKFDEEAFKSSEEIPKPFEKPDYKKFNIRFNSLDLLIIDAIAKRDNSSRSQIINNFLEDILKQFLLNCSKHEAVEIALHADKLNEGKSKLDKDFTWIDWYVESIHTNHYVYPTEFVIRELEEDVERLAVSREFLNLRNRLSK